MICNNMNEIETLPTSVVIDSQVMNIVTVCVFACVIAFVLHADCLSVHVTSLVVKLSHFIVSFSCSGNIEQFFGIFSKVITNTCSKIHRQRVRKFVRSWLIKLFAHFQNISIFKWNQVSWNQSMKTRWALQHESQFFLFTQLEMTSFAMDFKGDWSEKNEMKMT